MPRLAVLVAFIINITIVGTPQSAFAGDSFSQLSFDEAKSRSKVVDPLEVLNRGEIGIVAATVPAVARTKRPKLKAHIGKGKSKLFPDRLVKRSESPKISRRDLADLAGVSDENSTKSPRSSYAAINYASRKSSSMNEGSLVETMKLKLEKRGEELRRVRKQNKLLKVRIRELQLSMNKQTSSASEIASDIVTSGRARLQSQSSIADEKSSVVRENTIILVPWKKVDSDPENSSQITSAHGWIPGSEGDCSAPDKADQVTVKAVALNDVITKLTGNSMLSRKLCQRSCNQEDSRRTGILNRLKIADMHGGDFRFNLAGGLCYYQLSKLPKSGWQKLQVLDYGCGCYAETANR